MSNVSPSDIGSSVLERPLVDVRGAVLAVLLYARFAMCSIR